MTRGERQRDALGLLPWQSLSFCYAFRMQEGRRSRALPFLFFLVVAGLLFFATWPGLLTGDSEDQWRQAVYGPFLDWHPPGPAVLMRLVYRGLGIASPLPAVGALTLLQFVAFWGALFALVAALASTSRRFGWYVVALACYPPLWILSVTQTKDVFCSAWLFLALVVLYRSRGELTWPRWMLLGVLTFAAGMTRHTSLPSMGLLVGGYLFWTRARWRWEGSVPPRARWVPMAVVLLFATFAVQWATDALPLRRVGNVGNMFLTWDVVGASHFAGLSDANLDELATTRLYGRSHMKEAMDDYECDGDANYLIFGNFDYHRMLTSATALPDLGWLARHAPLGLLRHKLCVAGTLLQIGGITELFPHLDIWPPPSSPFVVHHPSLDAALRAISDRFEEGGWLSLPFQHWVWALASATLLAVAMLLFGTGDSAVRDGAFLFWAGISFAAPYLIVSPAGAWRYLFPSHVCWAVGTVILARGLVEAWAGVRRPVVAPAGAI